MDAVDLSHPVVVSVPAKLMGSEGCGGVRVSSNKTDSNCETARVPIDTGSSRGASDSSLWRKLIDSHDFVHKRLTKVCVETTSEQPASSGYKNGCLDITSDPTSSVCKKDACPENTENHRKAGKLSRSNYGASKRTKLTHLEDAMSSPRDSDVLEQGSALPSDKPQTVKQRNTCSSRRGDRRNSRVIARTFPTMNSSCGENAFFSAYGLKPELNDVTKLVEDVSVKKLLEGSYERPLTKSKVKKDESASNDTFMALVRNVISILPTPKPVSSLTSTELDLDSCTSQTLASPISSDIRNASEDGCLISHSKDHSFDNEMGSTPLNFPLCETTDVLRRLCLPPPKDLDSLLRDALKPSQHSKNGSDQRSAKQLPPVRAGLPHFPWSQAFHGNCRANSEAAKLLISRTLCQGQWSRIAHSTSSTRSLTDVITHLDSLSFNPRLVPSFPKQSPVGNPSQCKCASASLSTFDPEVSKDEEEDQRCPRVLAAARTLYDIAIQSDNGISKWKKKVSHKSMKSRKCKSKEAAVHEEQGKAPSSNQGRKDSAEHPKPSKRRMLSAMDNNKKGLASSSSTKMPPPPSKTQEKPANWQQKSRKSLGID